MGRSWGTCAANRERQEWFPFIEPPLPWRGDPSCPQSGRNKMGYGRLAAVVSAPEFLVRFIPTRVHGFLDYLVGGILIGLPFAIDVAGNGRPALIALGSFVILYSLLTDYEFGAVRFLRLRFHFLLDALVGIALLALPWFGLVATELQWLISAIGLLSLFLAATTKVRALGTAETH
jgi:hypothetical protein